MAEPFDGSTSHARRPLHQDDNSQQQQHQDEYPNPFQQPPQRSPSQQHYSILIPTVDHWPRIALEGLARGAVFTLDALSYAQRILHARVAQLRANSSSSYHVLPTSTADLHNLSPPSTPPRRIISFGSKRQQKQGSGYRIQCSSRRWTRVLALVTLVTLLITLIALPRRMNPFRSRVVWVRYYSHEEPVKVALPFGTKVHVSDVKATAMKAMAFGYERPLGQVTLISPGLFATLHPGKEWDDYDTDAWSPIIATDTGHELHDFLQKNLNCFTSHPSDTTRFKPESDGWYILYDTLRYINENIDHSVWLRPHHIRYLRKGFNDPQAHAPIWDMNPFISKQRNSHMGYDQPSYPSSTIPPWVVQPTSLNETYSPDPPEEEDTIY
ncbi:hypothetical protein BGZ81_010201 [Podila clonocystis]|nr:hypothetical protein BGZ81_010201 [Podila clonocystis]